MQQLPQCRDTVSFALRAVYQVVCGDDHCGVVVVVNLLAAVLTVYLMGITNNDGAVVPPLHSNRYSLCDSSPLDVYNLLREG